MQVLANLKMQ